MDLRVGHEHRTPTQHEVKPVILFIFRRFVFNGEVCGFQILAHEAVEQSGSAHGTPLTVDVSHHLSIVTIHQ
jgi:hypothetical protein